MFQSTVHALQNGDANEQENEVVTEMHMDIVRDPVCGELIDWRKAAGIYPYNGRLYYFCSRKCMEIFILFPARFAA